MGKIKSSAVLNYEESKRLLTLTDELKKMKSISRKFTKMSKLHLEPEQVKEVKKGAKYLVGSQ